MSRTTELDARELPAAALSSRALPAQADNQSPKPRSQCSEPRKDITSAKQPVSSTHSATVNIEGEQAAEVQPWSSHHRAWNCCERRAHRVPGTQDKAGCALVAVPQIAAAPDHPMRPRPDPVSCRAAWDSASIDQRPLRPASAVHEGTRMDGAARKDVLILVKAQMDWMHSAAKSACGVPRRRQQWRPEEPGCPMVQFHPASNRRLRFGSDERCAMSRNQARPPRQ